MQIDETKLKEVTNASQTAQDVMSYLASRDRHRDLNLKHIKKTIKHLGGKINDVDYAKFWAHLEVLGLGSIIHGRDGKSDYFKWNYDLKAIAEIAAPSISNRVKPVKLRIPRKPKEVNFSPSETKIIPKEVKSKNTILRKKMEMMHIDVTTPSGVMTVILPLNHNKRDLQAVINTLLRMMVE